MRSTFVWELEDVRFRTLGVPETRMRRRRIPIQSCRDVQGAKAWHTLVDKDAASGSSVGVCAFRGVLRR